MSKLVFNIEFLRAVEAGLIDLDATLGSIREDLPEHWRTITLRQAYSHISGLPDIWSQGIPSSATAALDFAKNADMEFEAGDRSQYNQTNFLLLWQHLESVTGRSYLDLLQANQLSALGLDHTSFELETAGQDQSLNYRAQRGNPSQLHAIDLPAFPSFVYSSVGLQASLNDLVAWTQALNRGELISRQTLLDHWRAQYRTDGSTAEHSNGWEIEMRDDVTAVGHGGGGRVNLRHYFQTQNADDNLTVIYLDNGGLQNFNHRGLSAVLADTVQPGIASEEEQLFSALVAAAASGHAMQAAAAFRDYAIAHDDLRGRREVELNRIGYAILRLHGPAAAIPAFHLEAELFPGSWNSQDSLGEAYRGAGHLAEALSQYQRALVLNPDSERLASIIDEIETELAEQH
jgi:CubicO group peptidase (beta-lactamase class C family)